MSAGVSAPRIGRGNSRAKRPTIRKPKNARPSRIAAMLATIPIPAETLKRIGNYALALLVLAAILAGLIAMRLPQMIGIEIGEAIGRMGFVVRNIEIAGRANVDRDAVYMIAREQRARAMPLVDLEGTRQRLLQLGWIAEARVSRRLPDTLVVDIVERKPTAVWQHQRRLALIDEKGVVIAAVDPAAMPDQLPLVIGPGANDHAAELAALIKAQPSLHAMLEGATWIGDRRWDLRFQSGETLALPEGRKAAADALAYFAHRDQAVRLLGQGYVRFDMRDPSRMVVRVSREPGRRIADAPAGNSI
ncbi:transposase [Sphingomonas oleivorans]|uniref:Cell division protein FtsQ n=1 Tax=Sphingomonas oleivorans TaxID=1735121 RepID=A0A2T5FY71_9SPHN|nr:cell division protein FtsQ/DivIB [Sphingomonas oleivorans]PTQ11480.1 transposase [Sphingomonas oleivorans]